MMDDLTGVYNHKLKNDSLVHILNNSEMMDSREHSQELKQEIRDCLKILHQHCITYWRTSDDTFQIIQNHEASIGYFRLTDQRVTEFSLYFYGGFMLRRNGMYMTSAVTKADREMAINKSFTVFGMEHVFEERTSPKSQRKESIFRKRSVEEDELEKRYEQIAKCKALVVVSTYYHAMHHLLEFFRIQCEQIPWHMAHAMIDRIELTEPGMTLKHMLALEGLCNEPTKMSSLAYQVGSLSSTTFP
jgi:hypothetical protein